MHLWKFLVILTLSTPALAQFTGPRRIPQQHYKVSPTEFREQLRAFAEKGVYLKSSRDLMLMILEDKNPEYRYLALRALSRISPELIDSTLCEKFSAALRRYHSEFHNEENFASELGGACKQLEEN